MIRDFIEGDQYRLKPNEFSDLKGVEDVFYDDQYEKYTLEDEGEIKCIICWQEFQPKEYVVFLLMPDGVQSFYAKTIKRFMNKTIKRLKPKLCLTYSFDCDMLDRWHKFLGFKQEDGAVLFEGKKFNKWIIRWV